MQHNCGHSISGLRLFYMVWVRLLLPITGTVDATAQNDILESGLTQCVFNFVETVVVSIWQHPPTQRSVYVEMVVWVWVGRTFLDCIELLLQPCPTRLGWTGIPALSQASAPNFTNTLVAEWEQIPAAMLQNLVGIFPRRVKAVIAFHILLALYCCGSVIWGINTWEWCPKTTKIRWLIN